MGSRLPGPLWILLLTFVGVVSAGRAGEGVDASFGSFRDLARVPFGGPLPIPSIASPSPLQCFQLRVGLMGGGSGAGTVLRGPAAPTMRPRGRLEAAKAE